MKLVNQLYEITKTWHKENEFSAHIRLNPGHLVYTGHFPGQPVTPAVIELHIVHELLEKIFDQPVRLLSISDSKFLKILNPVSTKNLIIDIHYTNNDNLIQAAACGRNEEVVFFKLTAAYESISPGT